MKMILCEECGDVFGLLLKEIRSCSCGKCFGMYIDNKNAVYSGESAIPVGVNNFSLIKAINNQPEKGMGETFESFVIPKECDSMKKLEEKENEWEQRENIWSYARSFGEGH